MRRSPGSPALWIALTTLSTPHTTERTEPGSISSLPATPGGSRGEPAPPQTPPNVVIILTDDLGYGDTGVYGHRSIKTPAIDRMAAEGLRFTDFYAGASVCTPSRAALLTGRHPVRIGLAGNQPRVLTPSSTGGLPAVETLAERMRQAGYVTGCIGKWHLGHLPQHLPTQHGFDSFYGVPYSNNMSPLPLLRNTTVVQANPPQSALTGLFTQEAIAFVNRHRNSPFFLLLSYTAPHEPLVASAAFAGTSQYGLYGDVVEELDSGVGQVLAAISSAGLDPSTLSLFLSDNGPSTGLGGSTGPFRGAKSRVYEGGIRVPCIARWPGRVPAGTVTGQLGSVLDLFPTITSITGIGYRHVKLLDGYDLSPVLLGTGGSPRRDAFFYFGRHLAALRMGKWKAHLTSQPYPLTADRVVFNPPRLYDLTADPRERFDVAPHHPQIVAAVLALADAHRRSVVTVPSRL